MHSTTLADGNILVPNGTFFVELVAFAVVLIVLWRVVLPPVRKAMTDRQELIKGQLEEGHAATERLKQATVEYQEALGAARTTAASIRNEARAEAGSVREQVLAEAEEKRGGILAAGREDLSGVRRDMVHQMRADLGTSAVDLAGRILGDSLVDEARRRGTVDRFLADLDSKAGPEATGPGSGAGQRPASAGGRR
ncbi:MAG: F0F1 ATP synthase subunit B [Actinocatenispora sp.]